VAAQIIELRERHRTIIGDAYDRGSKHAFALLDLLFKRPIVTANDVRDRLGISGGGARNLIKSLMSRRFWSKSQVTNAIRRLNMRLTPPCSVICDGDAAPLNPHAGRREA
jgi:DNA-binding MarR family transcriptional regulator